MIGEPLKEWAKTIRDLGAAGAIIIIAGYLVYVLASGLQANLRLIPAMADTIKAHMEESRQRVWLERLNCQHLAVIAKADPDRCLDGAPGAP